MQYECTVRRPTTQDLTGHSFDRLTVVNFAGYRQNAYWTCICTCGGIKDIQSYNLLNKTTRSCGCLAREKGRQLNTIHGQSTTPEYHIWWGMLQRCENPSSISYPLYGARGITVCDAWHDLQAFYADMGPRPSHQHSLERLDNNANYTPENCVWILRKLQARNRRRNLVLTYNNISQCAAAWAEETGISAATIAWRKRRHWSDEDALTRPVRQHKSSKYQPKLLSLGDNVR